MCGLTWQSGLQLSRQGNDTWTAETLCSEAELRGAGGVLELKVLIDDNQWEKGCNHQAKLDQVSLQGSLSATRRIDLNAHETTRTQGLNNTAELAPYFFALRGETMVMDRVASKELENIRSVIFYSPPGYEEVQ